jgi:WD40 repeat protein
MAPSEPTRLYMAPSGGAVFRSDDRGDHWYVASEGLPYDEGLNCIAVSPANPDVLLAGRSTSPVVYRSEDGGDSWVPSDTGIAAAKVNVIAYSPSNPNFVLAGTSDGSSPGMYGSQNGGVTWTWIATTQTTVLDLSFNPSSPNEVVAVGESPRAVMRSSDGGLSWVSVLEAYWVNTVDWSAADPGKVYAAGHTGAYYPAWFAYRSDDGGLTFNPLTMPTLSGTATMGSITAHPTDPERVYLGVNHWCWYPGDAWYGKPTLFHSSDSGALWQNVYEASVCDAGSGHVRKVLIDPTDPDYALFGVWAGNHHRSVGGIGIYRSDTGGVTDWELKIEGIGNSAVHQLAADLDGGVYVRDITYWSRDEIWKRSDPEASFTKLLRPCWYEVYEIHDFEVNLGDPDRLYDVGEWWDIDVGGSYYLWSEDGGTGLWYPWGIVPEGLDWWEVSKLVTANHGSGEIFYVWTGSGKLYRTEDYGWTFTHTGDPFTVVDAVISPNNDDQLFAAALGADCVLVSGNGGGSWSPRDTGLPADDPVALFMDRSDANHLVVVFATANPHETFDGGLAWSPVSCDLAGATVTAADWDSEEDRLFLVTQDDGVYVTGLGFANEGLPSRKLTSVAYSRPYQTLYVGTGSQGVFARRLPYGTGTPEVAAAAELHAGDLVVGPNPFRPATTIRFGVPAAGAQARVDIVDVRGRRVRTLLDGHRPGGTTSLQWDGRDGAGVSVAAGVYFVRLELDGKATTRQVVHVR